MRYDHGLKRRLVWLVALLSGIYLVVPLPWFTPVDPIPFLDEGVAVMIFLKATSWLGYDMSRWLPFLRSRSGKKSARSMPVTVDV